jgi:hypothetical protein
MSLNKKKDVKEIDKKKIFYKVLFFLLIAIILFYFFRYDNFSKFKINLNSNAIINQEAQGGYSFQKTFLFCII